MTATSTKRFTITFVIVFLSCFAVVFGGTVKIRNQSPGLRKDNAELKDSLICQITLVEIQFDRSSAADRSTQDEDFFECSPVQDNEVSDMSYRIDLSSIDTTSDERLLQGELFVSVYGGRIEGDDVILTKGSIVSVVPPPVGFQSRRHLVAKTGTLSVLVLRISTNDSSPSLSADEFHKLIFEDEVSLQKQYAACSFGKLNLIPTEYGVLDLYLNATAEGTKPISLVSKANEALRERLNIVKTTDASDLLLMIMPPGTGDWAAFSGVGHPRSVYNDMWGGYSSSLLHEVGHGLGLGHANEDGSDYTDYTSYMSAGHKQTNWPAKSFNAQNHWDLGWYEDRSVSVDPIAAPQLLKIAAFVDYDKTQQGEYVIAEVGGSLYMQYNRAKGFNRDTEEKADMLTISTKMDGGGTDLVAGLDLDSNTYLVAGFQGSDQDILIEVCNVGVGNGVDQPDYMIVSVGNGPSLCGQDYSPLIPSPTVLQERNPTEPVATDDKTSSGQGGTSGVSTTTMLLVILAVLSCLATAVLFVLRRRRASSKLETDSSKLESDSSKTESDTSTVESDTSTLESGSQDPPAP
jgi:hypothetical protein